MRLRRTSLNACSRRGNAPCVLARRPGSPGQRSAGPTPARRRDHDLPRDPAQRHRHTAQSRPSAAPGPHRRAAATTISPGSRAAPSPYCSKPPITGPNASPRSPGQQAQRILPREQPADPAAVGLRRPACAAIHAAILAKQRYHAGDIPVIRSSICRFPASKYALKRKKRGRTVCAAPASFHSMTTPGSPDPGSPAPARHSRRWCWPRRERQWPRPRRP